MRFLSILLALYWFGLFIAHIFGYKVDGFTAGCALLISSLSFVGYAVDGGK